VFGYDKTATMSVDTKSLFVTLSKFSVDLNAKLVELEQHAQEQQAQLKRLEQLKAEVQQETLTVVQPLTDATIQEGNKFIFECIVAGYPEPSIEWLKDGISIENNSDYKTKYDAGICTLIIEETLTADSAQFTCKATNTVGVAETSARLTIQEHETDATLAPPVFVKQLECGQAKEGESFEFKCVVEGNPLPNVQWFKNEVCVDNSSDYNITFNNGEAKFGLDEVFLEDQATYTCKASNVAGTTECSASLSVERKYKLKISGKRI
jgi:Immunoglobulin I-set domain